MTRFYGGSKRFSTTETGGNDRKWTPCRYPTARTRARPQSKDWESRPGPRGISSRSARHRRRTGSRQTQAGRRDSPLVLYRKKPQGVGLLVIAYPACRMGARRTAMGRMVRNMGKGVAGVKPSVWIHAHVLAEREGCWRSDITSLPQNRLAGRGATPGIGHGCRAMTGLTRRFMPRDRRN